MTSTPTPKANRKDFLLFVGILLLLVFAAITTGRLIAVHRHQALLARRPLPDARPGIRIGSQATAGKVQDMRSRSLAKANLLRDHWRVWAVAHEGSLRQLRQAPSSDTATLMRFYATLPTSVELNQKTGITLQDVGEKEADMNNERVAHVTWEPRPLQDTETVKKASEDRYSEALRRQFMLYHNVALSYSVSAGRSQITLWADGRITEMVSQDQHVIGKPTIVDGPEEEIAPPYDFLK